MRKQLLFTVVSLFALIIMLVNLRPLQATEASVELEPYYEVDSVYSTFSPSTNFTTGGAIYTSRGGLAVRPTTTQQVETGVTMPVDLEIEVTADTAIVIDIMVHTNMTRTMRLDLVEADGTVKMMQNTLPAYTAKDNQVVQTLTIGNLAFNNNLNASSGFATKNIATAYNQLVVPLTSYGYAIGETVSLQAVNLYRPPWSSAHYNKYVLSAAHVTEDFSTTEPFATEVLWDAAIDAYTLYGAAADHEDIRYLAPGQVLLSPSRNSAGTGIVQELVFKFPDALINENGLVETANLKGMTLEFLNAIPTAFNGHFKLYNDEGTAIANSNYVNLKTEKVSKTGAVFSSNAKYFYPAEHALGYHDLFVLYNFNATSEVTPESTESFYSAAGTLPAEISPYFTFTYDNNQTLEIDEVYFGTIRILTDDIAVHDVTVSSDEPVHISAVKGYVGNQTTIIAEYNDRTVESVTLNGEPMSQVMMDALFSAEGLTLTIMGPIQIDILFEGPEAFLVTFFDEDGVTVLGTDWVEPGSAAQPPADPIKPATQQFSYVFSGWDRSFDVVTEDMSVLATYEAVLNQYTVTFFDEDGETVLGTSTVDYGSAAQAPDDPSKPATQQFSYVFSGWSQSFDSVTEDMSVLATYESILNQYTVTFLAPDGETMLGTSTVDYGTAAQEPVDLELPSSPYYAVTIASWSAPFDAVLEDFAVIAHYGIEMLVEGNLIAPGLDTVMQDTAWLDAGLVFESNLLSVEANGTVDVSTPGAYLITYDVYHEETLIIRYVRQVHVLESPLVVIISLNPGVSTLLAGSTFEDAGATSTHGTVTVQGTVNPNVPGEYVIEYHVEVNGQTFTKSRYVTVIESWESVLFSHREFLVFWERKESFER